MQAADAVGRRLRLDFSVDPPPDVAVEVDVHHDSGSKLPIYAALGVPEIWRFDGTQMTLLRLEGDGYADVHISPAVPMLTDRILIDYLTRMREEGEFEALLAFDAWLQTLRS